MTRWKSEEVTNANSLFAEGSQRRLSRQRFSQSSVSFSAFMRFERALSPLTLSILKRSLGLRGQQIYSRCPAISLTRSFGGRNNETPQDVRLLCNRPTFWPAGSHQKDVIGIHDLTTRLLGESYNPASNSSTPRTQTRSRSKVNEFFVTNLLRSAGSSKSGRVPLLLVVELVATSTTSSSSFPGEIFTPSV